MQLVEFMSAKRPDIIGSSKLTSLHGCWPTFHDAEVLEFQLSRGDWIHQQGDVPPFIVAKVHVFVEKPGSRHVLATLRFDRVENVRMEGFNHQNAIYGLSIDWREHGQLDAGENASADMTVRFQSAFGMSAIFDCVQIEVIDAVLCSGDGRVLE